MSSTKSVEDRRNNLRYRLKIFRNLRSNTTCCVSIQLRVIRGVYCIIIVDSVNQGISVDSPVVALIIANDERRSKHEHTVLRCV